MGRNKKGKGAGSGPRGDVGADKTTLDPRFSGVLTNPIFKPVPKNEKKVTIDKRFQSMFHDKSFKLKYTVDKRGRPISSTTDENLRKYYSLDDDEEDVKSESSDSDEEENEGSEEGSSGEEKDDVPVPPSSSGDKTKLTDDVKKKLRSNEVDFARGEGVLVSEESSDGESSEDENAEETVDHEWGELDKDAPRTEDATRRLALCNMDWDRVKASDLMLLFSSFLPPGGVLSNVSIYPSEFGKQRMELEELHGPLELKQIKKEEDEDVSDQEDDKKSSDNEEGDSNASDDDEGSTFHREKLRQYQLNRLKYYYAVLNFDSPESAEKVYSECDGMEYESSAAKIDLRFVPDDTKFDEEPKELCDALPDSASYRPKFFTTTALQQIKVACTWDETDPTRRDIISRAHESKDKINDEDLKAYLASSSSESENEDGEQADIEGGDKSSDPISKYRMLLESIEKKEDEKKRDVELEVTWGVGLKEKAEQLVKKKAKEEDMKQLTPWEERLVRRSEKRKQRKHGNGNATEGVGNEDSDKSEDDAEQLSSDQPFSDDDVAIDRNDPFFKSLDLGNKKSSKKGQKKLAKEVPEEKPSGELELLMLDEDDKRKHFNFKKIVEDETAGSAKRKRKLKKKKIKGSEPGTADDFNVDINDGRFGALFTSHHFNIDPSEPNFKRTKGMDTIITAKQKLRLKVPEQAEEASEKVNKARDKKSSDDLSFLVKSIKNKTNAAMSSKRRKAK